MPTVHLLDYAAGNVRSLVNAIEKLGWHVEWIRKPSDVADAEVSADRVHVMLSVDKCADRMSCIEADLAWRRPLWPLSDSIRQCWVR